MRARRDHLWLSIRLLALVVGGAGCASSTAPEASLEVARERWERLGIDSYAITIWRSCDCTPEWSEPAVVVVRDGVVESRTYVRTGLPVMPINAGVYPTVDGLFERIEHGLQSDWGKLSVRYHLVFGYPTRYVFGDPDVDAPVTLARDLTPLQP